LTIDGSTHELVIGKSRIMLRIEDEAGRINPNLASGALLQGLLRASGRRPAAGGNGRLAIAEWVGSAGTPRPPPSWSPNTAPPGSITLRRDRHWRPSMSWAGSEA